jgi:hypothetical protein
MKESIGDHDDQLANPGALRPGVYRMKKARAEEPELVGRLTVTGH